MWYKKSNFLSQEDFHSLYESTKKFYKISKLENCEFKLTELDNTLSADRGKYRDGITVQKAKRVRFWSNRDDVQEESAGFFGPSIIKPVQQIREFLIDKGFRNIKLSNIWLQYGDTDTQMHRHSDGEIGGVSFDKCFTSLLFCHLDWNREWGGIFRIEEMAQPYDIVDFPATPNELVIWNRNHPHWMTPITQSNQLRMFLGTSWYQKD